MSKESTIEKYYHECLEFNRTAGYTIDETEFDITVAQTALQELYTYTKLALCPANSKETQTM